MTTIQYSKNMKCEDYETISAVKYEQICKFAGGYEYIPDDIPIKLYLDVDVKLPMEKPDDVEMYLTGEVLCVRREVEEVLRTAFGEQYKEDQIYWGSSHGIVDDYFKISFRVIFNNLIAVKAYQAVIVDKLNDSIHGIIGDVQMYNGEMFDTNTYHTANQIIRSPYTSKPKGDRPMKIESGTFEMSCITAFIPQDAILMSGEIPDKKRKLNHIERPDEIGGEDNMQLFDRGLHLLTPYAKSGQYKAWTTIVWAIKNVFNNYTMALEFSKLDLTAFDEDSLLSLWDSAVKQDNGVGMGTICHYMRKTDPEEYARISKSIYQTQIRSDGLKALQKLIDEVPKPAVKKQEQMNFYIKSSDIADPYIVASTISKTIKSKLVFSCEQWYIVESNNLWALVKEPYCKIIEEIRKYIDYSHLKCAEQNANTPDGQEKDILIKSCQKYLESYVKITNGNYMSNVTKLLKDMLRDNEFAKKLDMNAGYLAFKNGVMDLKTHIFRHGILPSDLITKTIPSDYTPATSKSIEFVKDVLLKILNNNPEHMEYYLSLIAFSMIGMPHLQKSMYFCVDNTALSKGDNGKTLFFDVLSCIMPNYVYKTKATFLENDNKKVHKQLALMKGSRLVWMDEFSKKAVNAELMKEMADGKTTENEVMYGTSETIDILFKLWILTNNMPNIGANDEAVYNRYQQISYGSHFDRTGTRTIEDPSKLEFIADQTLPDKLKTDYKDALIQLIIDYACKYLNSNKLPDVPLQFKADASKTKLKNDEFKCWFNDNCVEDYGRVALKHIVKESGMNEKAVKEGMARLGFVYNKDLSKLGKDMYGKPYKGGYEGCSIIEIPECEEENQEEKQE